MAAVKKRKEMQTKKSNCHKRTQRTQKENHKMGCGQFFLFNRQRLSFLRAATGCVPKPLAPGRTQVATQSPACRHVGNRAAFPACCDPCAGTCCKRKSR